MSTRREQTLISHDGDRNGHLSMDATLHPDDESAQIPNAEDSHDEVRVGVGHQRSRMVNILARDQ